MHSSSRGGWWAYDGQWGWADYPGGEGGQGRKKGLRGACVCVSEGVGLYGARTAVLLGTGGAFPMLG